jgi:hypothetical protein
MSAIPTYRDLARKFSPPWMRGYTSENPPDGKPKGNLEKLVYLAALQLDVIGTMAEQAARIGMPLNLSVESLPLIGKQRRVIRHLDESDTDYGSRLLDWLGMHRRRGTALELLRQIYLHYKDSSGGAFPVDLIYRSGFTYHMAANGLVTTSHIANWQGDGPPEKWATFTLIYYTDLFINGTDPGAIVQIPRAYIPAHAQGTLIVLGTGAALIDFHPPHLINEADTIDTPVGALRYTV